MPAGDGTGPQGQGPRTGRGMGNCQSNSNSGRQSITPASNTGPGLGRRMWENTLGSIFRRKRGQRGNRR